MTRRTRRKRHQIVLILSYNDSEHDETQGHMLQVNLGGRLTPFHRRHQQALRSPFLAVSRPVVHASASSQYCFAKSKRIMHSPQQST